MFGSPYTQTGLPTTFDTGYPDHPWAGISTNERMYYDPLLRDVYRLKAIFGQYITYAQNLRDRGAKTMTVTSLYDIHPNFDRLGLRTMWMPASHVDTKNQTLTFERYGGKVAYDAYTPIITYWNAQAVSGGGKLNAISAIVNDKLGQHMTDVMDMLARNAILQSPFKLFGSGKTSFNDLTVDDTATTSMLNEVHLGMKYRGVPYAQTGNGSVGTIVCITSPGVLHDLQQQTDPKDWLVPMAYGDPSRLLNSEVGTFRNIRFVETPKATLFNCGKILIQATVKTAINAGDGTPASLVDGTFVVGQPGATKRITLADGTDMTQFSVGDIVTIHSARTNEFGVTNGVDYRDGTLHNRRIVGIINESGPTVKGLQFDEPIMIDFTTALDTNVYAYVTKGLHVHAMMFVGGRDGIVAGVGRPPRLHAPPPVDDFNMIHRFSWDSYMGYNLWNPKVLETVFVSGSFRYSGATQLQG